MDLYGLVTIVNLNRVPAKISPVRVTVDGQDFPLNKFFFREKGVPERFSGLSVMGNDKGHYELHFMFPNDKYSEVKKGEFSLSSSGAEPFVVDLTFS